MNRPSGFYWVRFYDKWTIAEYVREDDTEYWYILASDEMFDNSFFQEIGDKINDITRTNGFYWVMENPERGWYIAEWIDDSFYVCGLDYPIREKNFFKIGEKVKCPYEQE